MTFRGCASDFFVSVVERLRGAWGYEGFLPQGFVSRCELKSLRPFEFAVMRRRNPCDAARRTVIELTN